MGRLLKSWQTYLENVQIKTQNKIYIRCFSFCQTDSVAVIFVYFSIKDLVLFNQWVIFLFIIYNQSIFMKSLCLTKSILSPMIFFCSRMLIAIEAADNKLNLVPSWQSWNGFAPVEVFQERNCGQNAAASNLHWNSPLAWRPHCNTAIHCRCPNIMPNWSCISVWDNRNSVPPMIRQQQHWYLTKEPVDVLSWNSWAQANPLALKRKRMWFKSPSQTKSNNRLTFSELKELRFGWVSSDSILTDGSDSKLIPTADTQTHNRWMSEWKSLWIIIA